MRASTIDRRTRSLHRRWTALAVGAATIAAGVSSLTGGPDAWIRMVVGAVSVAAIAAACREQLPLRVGLGLGLLNAAFVPIEIGVDRTLIAATAGVSLLVASEATAVAQRLLTSAPVTSTRDEAAQVVGRTAAATGAVLVVVAIAQVGRLGAAIAVIAVIGASVTLVALTTSDESTAET